MQQGDRLRVAYEALSLWVSLHVSMTTHPAKHFLAIVTLNLLEVSPRAAHLPFLLAAATSWTAAFTDATDFWIDPGICRCVSALIESFRISEPTALGPGQALRDQTNRLLPAMVRVGVAEAARIEQALAAR